MKKQNLSYYLNQGFIIKWRSKNQKQIIWTDSNKMDITTNRLSITPSFPFLYFILFYLYIYAWLHKKRLNFFLNISLFEKILTFLLPEVSFSRVSMPPLKETGDRVPSTDSSLNQSCNEDFVGGPLILDPWICTYFQGKWLANLHSIL